MAKNGDTFFRHFRHNGENDETIDGENGKMAKNNGENVRHFRHNCEKIDGKKMARKSMAKWRKWREWRKLMAKMANFFKTYNKFYIN